MRYTLLIITALFMVAACKNKPQSLQQIKDEKDLPADFREFYQKFHTDSLYQIAHIEWPLKGEKGVGMDTTSTRRLTEWTPETWRMMRMPDMSMSTLKRQFETVGDVLIVERMAYPMVGMGYERQFYKEEDGQWRLIYYGETLTMVLE